MAPVAEVGNHGFFQHLNEESDGVNFFEAMYPRRKVRVCGIGVLAKFRNQNKPTNHHINNLLPHNNIGSSNDGKTKCFGFRKKTAHVNAPIEMSPINTLFVTEGECHSKTSTEGSSSSCASYEIMTTDNIPQFNVAKALQYEEPPEPSPDTPKHKNSTKGQHFHFGSFSEEKDDDADDDPESEQPRALNTGSQDSCFGATSETAGSRDPPEEEIAKNGGAPPPRLLTPGSSRCSPSSSRGRSRGGRGELGAKNAHQQHESPPIVKIRSPGNMFAFNRTEELLPSVKEIITEDCTGVSSISSKDSSTLSPRKLKQKEEAVKKMKELIDQQQQNLAELADKNQMYRDRLAASHDRVQTLRQEHLDSKDQLIKLRFERESFEAEAVWLRAQLRAVKTELSDVKHQQERDAVIPSPGAASSEVRWLRTQEVVFNRPSSRSHDTPGEEAVPRLPLELEQAVNRKKREKPIFDGDCVDLPSPESLSELNPRMHHHPPESTPDQTKSGFEVPLCHRLSVNGNHTDPSPDPPAIVSPPSKAHHSGKKIEFGTNEEFDDTCVDQKKSPKHDDPSQHVRSILRHQMLRSSPAAPPSPSSSVSTRQAAEYLLRRRRRSAAQLQQQQEQLSGQDSPRKRAVDANAELRWVRSQKQILLGMKKTVNTDFRTSHLPSLSAPSSSSSSSREASNGDSSNNNNKPSPRALDLDEVKDLQRRVAKLRRSLSKANLESLGSAEKTEEQEDIVGSTVDMQQVLEEQVNRGRSRSRDESVAARLGRRLEGHMESRDPSPSPPCVSIEETLPRNSAAAAAAVVSAEGEQ